MHDEVIPYNFVHMSHFDYSRPIKTYLYIINYIILRRVKRAVTVNDKGPLAVNRYLISTIIQTIWYINYFISFMNRNQCFMNIDTDKVILRR